jgi:hypothetical protein
MSDDEQTQLAELRKKRAELEGRRAIREAARLVADEIDSERRALALAEALEKAETEIGPLGRKLGIIETNEGAIIVKVPPAPLFHRFQELSSRKDGFSVVEIQKLIRPCLVYPSAAEFERIVSELPATLVAVGNKLAELAGQRAEEAAGK